MSCPACFSGSVHDGTPRGKVTKMYGLDTYVIEPTDGRPPKGIVVFLPDAFGWDFVNCRLLADKYAEKGQYTVYLPDFMFGTAAPVWTLDAMKVMSNPGNIFKKIYTLPWLMSAFLPFMIRNRAGVRYPQIKKFMEDLRHNEAAALPVGVAGFCWGGKMVALLAGDETIANGKPLIDAGFTAHPSMLALPADIENIKKPVSFACPESDMQVSLAQAAQIKAIVEAKPEGARGEVVIFEGVQHGFAVRANLGVKSLEKQADDAEDQCVRWFQKHFEKVQV